MKLAIMQPYFFPYIGYWQLIYAVDEYVIYDDVNFIKSGWINRNRILVQGTSQYFNVQIQGASSFKKINEIVVNPSLIWRKKALSTITMAYQKAPYYFTVFPILKDIIFCQEELLSQYIINSIQIVCKYLHINTKLWISSTIEQDRSLHGQARVLDICKRLKATSYYNAIGGQELYSKNIFKENGLELYFVKTNNVEYSQYKSQFIPNLSIIDVMMFNSNDRIREMLDQYELK